MRGRIGIFFGVILSGLITAYHAVCGLIPGQGKTGFAGSMLIHFAKTPIPIFTLGETINGEGEPADKQGKKKE